MQKRMRKLVLILVLGIGAWCGRLYWTTPALQGGSGPATPIAGGTYHAALSANPPTFDPALATDTTSVAAQGPVTSAIAESWEMSADGLVYTFHLSPRVRFHASTEGGRATANAGRQVNANDVKFSFERVLDPKTESARTQIFSIIQGADEFMAGKTQAVSGIEALAPAKEDPARH
ncbi:MAG: peptide/nickel transport system substrate-binding protein, partial [bacterium]